MRAQSSLYDLYIQTDQHLTGERTINRLPSAMLSDLAGLAHQDLSVIASKWASTDEMGWEPNDASDLIDELIRMARRASETGKSVYLWNSV